MGSRGNVGFLRAAGCRVLAKPGASPGFALLIVLWVLVFISFMIAQLVAQGRTEIRIADNIYANAAAEAALDGAVSVAVYKLSDPRPEQRWAFDSGVHELAVGKSRIRLSIENEAWRINPNFASPALLEGLLRATGSGKETAKQLSIAIAEWVGATITGRSPEDAAADYRAAGFDYRPPRQPIERLDDLAGVLGMTPGVLAAIRPHLTVYGPPVPDTSGADPIVAAALAVARAGPGSAPVTARGWERPGALVTARILASAKGPGSAEAERNSIVRFNQSEPQGFVVLARGDAIE